VEETWLWLADQYEFVHLDEYVIMPNHLHGIIVIGDTCRGGTRTVLRRGDTRTVLRRGDTRTVLRRGDTRSAPTGVAKRKPLGRLVGAFKTVSTKHINEIRGTLGVPVWQRNYYERVIRNGEELNRVRQYIIDNPAHWEQDHENPNNVGAVREPPLPD